MHLESGSASNPPAPKKSGSAGNLPAPKKSFAASVLILALLVFAITVSGSAAGTRGDVKRGKQVFYDLQCSICHANGGNSLNPERPLVGAPFLKRYPQHDDKGLAKIIREGISAKGMPDFGKDKMSDQDLADVMVYIRSLTPAKAAAPPAKHKSKAKASK